MIITVSIFSSSCVIVFVSGAHGATDITGFGILGHARNLAKCQKNAVNFQIHTLPSKSNCI